MKTNDKLTSYLDSIYTVFKEGTIHNLLPILNINQKFVNTNKLKKYDSPFPSDRWSLFNQLCLAFDLSVQIRFNKAKIASEIDTKAAGFRQWNALGRKIKQGSKVGGYIFVPHIVEKKDNKTQDDKTQDNKNIEKVKVLSGFLIRPIFFYFQTEQIPGQENKLKVPVFEIPYNFDNLIKTLNIKIKTGYSLHGEYGSTSLKNSEIKLASSEKSVFYHELAHAIHKNISKTKLLDKQDPEQEIIAELTSMMLSYKLDNVVYQDNIDYIKAYAEQITNKKSVLKILDTTDKILNYIISNIIEEKPDLVEVPKL